MIYLIRYNRSSFLTSGNDYAVFAKLTKFLPSSLPASLPPSFLSSFLSFLLPFLSRPLCLCYVHQILCCFLTQPFSLLQASFWKEEVMNHNFPLCKQCSHTQICFLIQAVRKRQTANLPSRRKLL